MRIAERVVLVLVGRSKVPVWVVVKDLAIYIRSAMAMCGDAKVGRVSRP
jgi:aldehyde:ferredoxin oxidoreductase